MPAITARQSTKTDATPQPLAPSILVVFLYASSVLHRAIAVVFVLAPALVSSGPCSFTSALAALPVHTARELVSSANNIWGRIWFIAAISEVRASTVGAGVILPVVTK